MTINEKSPSIIICNQILASFKSKKVFIVETEFFQSSQNHSFSCHSVTPYRVITKLCMNIHLCKSYLNLLSELD